MPSGGQPKQIIATVLRIVKPYLAPPDPLPDLTIRRAQDGWEPQMQSP
jgi:hypothetical protein